LKSARPNSIYSQRYPASVWKGRNNLIGKISQSSRDGNVQNKKVMVVAPCELDGWTERGVDWWVLKAAQPSSFCGPRYPALVWKGRNNLIEKKIGKVTGMEMVRTKEVMVVAPCKLDGWTGRGDDWWVLKATQPNSFCGPRYPALGQEGRNNLIGINKPK